MEELGTVTLRMSIALFFLVNAAPAPAQTDTPGVRSLLQVIEWHESRGDCTDRPPEPHSARGCYQMTRIALEDIGLKNAAGDWLRNPFGVTSDEEFEQHREANDYAAKQFAIRNWSYFHCETRYAECLHPDSEVPLDPSALLSVAHFLGGLGMNDFVRCGLGEECLPSWVVGPNGGDRTRLHRALMDRMDDASGFDVRQLTDQISGCNRSDYCGR